MAVVDRNSCRLSNMNETSEQSSTMTGYMWISYNLWPYWQGLKQSGVTTPWPLAQGQAMPRCPIGLWLSQCPCSMESVDLLTCYRGVFWLPHLVNCVFVYHAVQMVTDRTRPFWNISCLCRPSCVLYAECFPSKWNLRCTWHSPRLNTRITTLVAGFLTLFSSDNIHSWSEFSHGREDLTSL